MRPWEEFVPAAEREVYAKAGYGKGEVKLGSPALVVIDVTGGFIGGMSPEEMMESSTACGGSWEAIKHIVALMERFRGKNLPVVFTTADQASETYLGKATRRPSGSSDKDPRRDLIPGVIAPRPDEYVIAKPRASCFFNTPLATYFRLKGVDTLLVTGVSTSGCVRASVVDAFSHGFNVFVVEEAVFDRATTLHLANLYDMNAKYAQVITAEKALSLIDGISR